jgi:cysteine synthase A
VSDRESSITGAIGGTPLVELSRITSGRGGRILVKLEYLSPGFSKKDRAALRIVEEAEATGDLQPGQTVLELTSGNMGTGLAIVCTAKGYPFVAVMSKGNSPERAAMMRALGAEVVLVEQSPGSKPGEVSGADLALVDAEAVRLTDELGAFRADQFESPGNRNAHYFGTGPEIWQQSGGAITAFCDFAGSGGTFAGCTQYFKEQNPDIACFVVEPEEAAVLSGAAVTNPDHPIQGGGYAMEKLTQLDGVTVDGFLRISSRDAVDCTRRLAREEGIFAGFSSGANLAAALQVLDGPLPGATIAIIACDSGLKYLSTALWS